MDEKTVKQQILEIGRRMYEKDLVVSNAGNISVRISENEILCTPTGVSKGFMSEESICKIDMEGNLLEANGNYRPSSEMKMHRRVYLRRPDIKAVVHAHPIYATTFAAAGLPLDARVLAEPIVDLDYVPLAPYGTPSTDEVPDSLEPFLKDYNAILLGNHGALTYAQDLIHAYYNMELVEFYARIMYQLNNLGQMREFTKEELDKLFALRRK